MHKDSVNKNIINITGTIARLDAKSKVGTYLATHVCNAFGICNAGRFCFRTLFNISSESLHDLLMTMKSFLCMYTLEKYASMRKRVRASMYIEYK